MVGQHSEETKRKISEKMKGIVRSEETKKKINPPKSIKTNSPRMTETIRTTKTSRLQKPQPSSGMIWAHAAKVLSLERADEMHDTQN